MAVYVTRKKKVEEESNVDVLLVFMSKSRLLLEFSFYKAVQDLQKFQQVWADGEPLSFLTEGLILDKRLTHLNVCYVICAF